MAMTSEGELRQWIRRFRPAPGSPRLLCLPHAGGAASFFFPIARAMAPEVDVLAVQYPGRQDRRMEPPFGSVVALADALFDALGPDDGTPLSLFGHSMGAVVGFELARRLEAGGRPATVLFASARRGPTLPLGEAVHQRGDAGIIAELRRLNGTELTLLENDELLRMIMPAARADFRAVETYRPAPDSRVNCPIVAMVGDKDPAVPVAEAEAWSEVTDGPFELLVHPGGHFYLLAGLNTVTGEIVKRLRSFEPGAGAGP
jgi:surfactin synthase thioesterase subunit